MTTTPLLEATDLTVRFGDVTALAGLDLLAPAGEVLAVLGPNGAGKTTFVRTIATLLAPTSGRLCVHGVDVARDPLAVRRSIGLAGQHAAAEPAAAIVIEQLSLGEVADRRCHTYSGGQRRRLDLGASLVGAPRLLLLDEPTTGLDPRSRSELWDAIRELVENGTDVLLTTQYLDEADHLADQVVIVDHGRAVATGTPNELKRRIGGNVVELHVSDVRDVAAAAELLGRLDHGAPQVDAATRRVSVRVDADGDG